MKSRTAKRLEHAEYHCAAGLLPGEARESLGVQLVRHGIKANRKVLETAARYSHEQGADFAAGRARGGVRRERDGTVKNRYCAPSSASRNRCFRSAPSRGGRTSGSASALTFT